MFTVKDSLKKYSIVIINEKNVYAMQLHSKTVTPKAVIYCPILIFSLHYVDVFCKNVENAVPFLRRFFFPSFVFLILNLAVIVACLFVDAQLFHCLFL